MPDILLYTQRMCYSTIGFRLKCVQGLPTAYTSELPFIQPRGRGTASRLSRSTSLTQYLTRYSPSVLAIREPMYLRPVESGVPKWRPKYSTSIDGASTFRYGPTHPILHNDTCLQ